MRVTRHRMPRAARIGWRAPWPVMIGPARVSRGPLVGFYARAGEHALLFIPRAGAARCRHAVSQRVARRDVAD